MIAEAVAPVAPPAADALVHALCAVLPAERVLWRPYDLMLYEYDGSIERHRPAAVVFPLSAREVSEILQVCNRLGVPYTARGAGTGLSGGALPSPGGVLVSLARMNRILEINPENRCALVEPGVVNLRLGQAVQPYGLSYVPDPSSQKACTIGGNVGENSGGPHTLRYGVTTNHTLGLEVVLPDGAIVQVGGASADCPGLDLVGLFVGSEGTLGIVTRIWVRLIPIAESVKTLLAVFPTIDAACEAVAGCIARRIVPAALEMMDNMVIRAVESVNPAGYPVDAAAVLLAEVDGLRDEVDAMAGEVEAVCWAHGASDVRMARNDLERARLWAGRKGAFGALGRITPDYYTVDGVVPRTRLPEVLRAIAAIGDDAGFRIANVFHAGDGNLHPLILWDADVPGAEERVVAAGAEIMRVCAEAGGSLSGEHGIGLEKRDLMPLIFGEADMGVMHRVKDAIDPRGQCNPGKVFPTAGRCLEIFARRGMAVGW
ncbi:MAG: FAD-binding protein [Chloroflexi bacterium]|nr:FAD-binding protein [Chloroflexota bacterium]